MMYQSNESKEEGRKKRYNERCVCVCDVGEACCHEGGRVVDHFSRAGQTDLGRSWTWTPGGEVMISLRMPCEPNDIAQKKSLVQHNRQEKEKGEGMDNRVCRRNRLEERKSTDHILEDAIVQTSLDRSASVEVLRNIREKGSMMPSGQDSDIEV